MTYKILEYCVRCGGGSFECPAGDINEGKQPYITNPAKCTGRGQCVTGNHCPAWAIVKE